MLLSKLKRRKTNPRLIKSDKLDKLCNSIKEFPKMMGMTKKQFFKAEFEALQPREQGLFDDLVGSL